jgi:FixJ family two-component response regulator
VDERGDALSVVLVDDDAAVRDSLALLLGLRGYRTVTFASAEDLLAAVTPDWFGCVVADLRMPGKSGLELAAELQARGIAMPVVIITAHGDVASARTAFRLNAVDFLEKPFDDDALVDAIESGRDRFLAALSPREREIAELVAQGMRNPAIAGKLGISPRTVEVHKARIMDKLGARGLDELIRIMSAK